MSLLATLSSSLDGSQCLDGLSFQAVVHYGLATGVSKMLALCSAQANVVCAERVGGKHEGPPLFGGDILFSSAGDGPPSLMHAKQMPNHRTVSLDVFLNCSSASTRRELHPKAALHEAA